MELVSPDELHKRTALLRLEQLKRRRQKAEQRSLIHYLRRIWPWFVVEEIHLLMAGYIEALVFSELDAYMQFLPPRAGKSMIASILTPSFDIGNFPADKVMQAGHSAELAVDFGREAKDIVASEDFQAVFPGIQLRADAKAAGRWFTNKRGAYYATGVTGGIAGKGWNFGSADDLLNEQTAYSDAANRRVNNWWGPGFFTRRQPERSRHMLTMTRWRKDDIAGMLLQRAKENPKATQYTVLKVPALLDAATAELLNEYTRDPLLSPSPTGKPIRYKEGDSFAPRRWPKAELLKQQANMSSKAWQALYQQDPTDEEGAILKRSWWRKWPVAEPPTCDLVIQVYDTAFEEEEMGITRSGKKEKEPDFSARTTWGIFQHLDNNKVLRPCMILLERMNKRMSFPDLRREAAQSAKTHKPDLILIEKKASGISLLQELRRKGLAVRAVEIGHGASKTARAHGASVVFEQGCVFYMDRNWAEEVIGQCADFPFGQFDDLVDTVVHAALWLRRGMHVRLEDEPPEEDESRFEPVAGAHTVLA